MVMKYWNFTENRLNIQFECPFQCP